MRPAEIFREPGDGYERRVIDTEGIHGLRIGREQNVGAHLLQATGVALQGARIVLEVLVRTELCRVDVDRYDDTLCVLTRRLHKTDMPGVQVTHRRHERDMLTCVPPLGEQLRQLGFALDNLHRTTRNNAPASDTRGSSRPAHKPATRQGATHDLAGNFARSAACAPA